MRYLGGKSKIRKQVAAFLESVRKENQPYFEPFVGGDWIGGYARSEGKSCYAATSKRSLLKQLPKIKDVEFVTGLFNEHNPQGCLVYCDPPYQGTTAYGAFDSFDHELFWSTMREWSKTNTVVVSEYSAPDDFVCVQEFQSQMGLTTKQDTGKNERPKRTEKLFMHNLQRRNKWQQH